MNLLRRIRRIDHGEDKQKRGESYTRTRDKSGDQGRFNRAAGTESPRFLMEDCSQFPKTRGDRISVDRLPISVAGFRTFQQCRLAYWQKMWHTFEGHMRILAAALLFIFVLPMICVALPSTVFGSMPGHCHGRSSPVSDPDHSCCRARPASPAHVQVTPSPRSHLLPSLEFGIIDSSSILLARAPVDKSDPSPPPQLILRI